MSEPTVVSRHDSDQVQLRTYVIGFVLSIFLTLSAYLAVTRHWFTKDSLVATLVALALMQFGVQLVFFLHLKAETKPRWKLLVFVFMLGIVSIIVFGSLWIMNNLNYRMTPQQTEQYLKDQDGGL